MSGGLLEGRIIMVTGGAGGFGQSIIEACVAQGARAVSLDRSHAALADSSSASLTYDCDLLDRAAVNSAVSDVVERFGRIDGLVCSAGGGSGAVTANAADALDPEALVSAYEQNVVTTVNVVNAARAGLLAALSGAVVVIGSQNGRKPLGSGTYTHYSAAKAALHMYTRSLARALGPSGVRANCMAPGTVLTPRLRQLWTDEELQGLMQQKALRRLPSPAEIANVAVFLLSDLSSYITGQVIEVDGGDDI